MALFPYTALAAVTIHCEEVHYAVTARYGCGEGVVVGGALPKPLRVVVGLGEINLGLHRLRRSARKTLPRSNSSELLAWAGNDMDGVEG